MDETRLEKIEAGLNNPEHLLPDDGGPESYYEPIIRELIAEVRRLRDELDEVPYRRERVR